MSTSAFGVEHGYEVAKSYVPGKGFVAAAELTGKQRKLVAAGGTWRKAKGVTAADEQFRRDQATNRALVRQHGIQRVEPGKGAEHHIARRIGPGHMGGTLRFGSKSHGESYILGEAGTAAQRDMVFAHEKAHAAPKRSAYRLHGQILTDPVKTFREEARADMAPGAQGHYTQLHRNPRTRGGNSQSVYAQLARAQRSKQRAPHAESEYAAELAGRRRPRKATTFRVAGKKLSFQKNPNVVTNRRIWPQMLKNSKKVMSGVSTGRGYQKVDGKAVRAYRQVQDNIANSRAQRGN